MDLNDHIEKILWTEQQISERVSQLGSQITQDLESGKVSPAIVGVATGAFLFTADLVRKIHLPITVDFIRVESYGSGTVSSGRPSISFDLKLDVRGKHVILVRVILTVHCLYLSLDSNFDACFLNCSWEYVVRVRRKIKKDVFFFILYLCAYNGKRVVMIKWELGA